MNDEVGSLAQPPVVKWDDTRETLHRWTQNDTVYYRCPRTHHTDRVNISLPERFELQGELGRGGMAVVYRAHDRHLDRPVAIKVIDGGDSDPVTLERFRREIGLTANLVHPGIVALFDSGETEGHVYYVMPLIAGDTLRARMKREGRLSMHDAATIGADVAEALAYAHGSGIVHRDVKPENIFLVGGRAVLADFGIARTADRYTGGTKRSTGAGMVVGTMAYMSPEQASGDPEIDGRSDVYSLACVLYELVAGEPPFSGRTELAVLAKHMTESPPPLRSRGVDVSEEFESLITRMLAKEAGQRGRSAAEIAPLLRAAAAVVTPPSAGVQSSPALTTVPAATQVDRLVQKAGASLAYATIGGSEVGRRIDEARVYLDAAHKIEPGNVSVLTSLSRWHYVSAVSGNDPEENVAQGARLMFEALVADDTLMELQLHQGKVALYFEDDFPVAERAARRAVELAPHDPENLRLLSIVQKINRQLEESIATAVRATEVSPHLPYVWNTLGDSLLAAGRNAEAVIALQRAIGLQAGYLPALERLELARVRLGEFEYAVEIRASRLRLSKMRERADLLESRSRAFGPAEARRLDIHRELDDMLKEAEKNNPFRKYVIGRNLADRIINAYAELGQWSDAMTWVERAYEANPGRLRRILIDQPFDYHGLAADARYARLLRVAGLEELL